MGKPVRKIDTVKNKYGKMVFDKRLENGYTYYWFDDNTGASGLIEEGHLKEMLSLRPQYRDAHYMNVYLARNGRISLRKDV